MPRLTAVEMPEAARSRRTGATSSTRVAGAVVMAEKPRPAAAASSPAGSAGDRPCGRPAGPAPAPWPGSAPAPPPTPLRGRSRGTPAAAAGVPRLRPRRGVGGGAGALPGQGAGAGPAGLPHGRSPALPAGELAAAAGRGFSAMTTAPATRVLDVAPV